MTTNRLFRFELPHFSLGSQGRSAGIYAAGVLFSLGVWFFIDASVFSKVANAGEIHITFVDWIPSICSGLGLLIVNSINKSRLTGDSYGDYGIAWKARLILFMGFALLAGGLAGSVVILILKYVIPAYPFETLYFGIANVIANGLVMLSSATLWVAQNSEDEYNYQLQL